MAEAKPIPKDWCTATLGFLNFRTTTAPGNYKTYFQKPGGFPANLLTVTPIGSPPNQIVLTPADSVATIQQKINDGILPAFANNLIINVISFDENGLVVTISVPSADVPTFNPITGQVQGLDGGEVNLICSDIPVGVCCTIVTLYGELNLPNKFPLQPRFAPEFFDNRIWWVKYYIGTTNILGGVAPGNMQFLNTMTPAEIQALIDADLTYIAWKAGNPTKRSITLVQWNNNGIGGNGIGVRICAESLQTQDAKGTMSQLNYPVPGGD